MVHVHRLSWGCGMSTLLPQTDGGLVCNYLSTTDTREGVEYRIGLVADRDEQSRVGGECTSVCVVLPVRMSLTAESYTWSSYLRTGVLLARSDGSLSVRLDQTTELSSHLSEKGRGTELSELIVFNGKLYTVDDRSGIGEVQVILIVMLPCP